MISLDIKAVKAIREHLGLTQTEAARRCDWPRSQWCNLEHGRNPDVKISTLNQLAKALNCQVADLLSPGAHESGITSWLSSQQMPQETRSAPTP